jgi:anti-anti-sigma factor
MRRISWGSWPLALKLTLTITTLLVAVTVSVTFLSIRREQQTFRAELESQARLLLNTVSAASADRLIYLDQTFLSDIMRSLGENQIVLGGRIYDAQGRIIADATDPQAVYQSASDPLGQQLVHADGTVFEWQDDQLGAGQAISAGRERLGAIRISLSTLPLQAKMQVVRTQGLSVALAAAMIGALFALFFSRSITNPVRRLTHAAQAIASGNRSQPIAIRGNDELAVLSTVFNHMNGAIQEREASLQQLAASLEQRVADRTAELEQSVAALRETARARDQLSLAIRELSNPVVPIAHGILVMPLVGIIDMDRAAMLPASLLKAIEQHRAQTVIIDVTGVPLIDTQGAQTLLHAAAAARLLGAETVLVGLRPELAQTIVGLGLSLAHLVTLGDLQSGVSYALSRKPGVVVHKPMSSG